MKKTTTSKRAPRKSTGKRSTATAMSALGPRALRTRDRLLEIVADMLGKRSVLDISVVDIARQAEASPGTFYHYFPDVQTAALELAERAAEEMPAVVELIDGPWKGKQGLERARTIVRAFTDHWDQHHAVLSLRNLSADLGDERFQRVRRRSLAPVLSHFASRIRESQEAGHVSKEIHPEIAAAAISAMLERLSAHYHALEPLGVTREDLIETCARMIHHTVTGRTPRS